ncbi:MAG: bifunctional nuclease family protein [Lentisphaerae bacterium]|nr:bifunctional nuclease family protein [Lentisphaerota bacterium]
MISVQVDQLFLSNLGFVVLLKSAEDERTLPIFIGAAEAQSIALQINDVKVPRPLTHDLLRNLLDFVECHLRRIEIININEGTFYAALVLERDAGEVRLDCRPSDAIALALRVGAPMFVAEGVMSEAGRIPESSEEESTAPADPATRPRMTPQQLLERQLKKAIKDERYEDAARLRDELKHIEDTHGSN